MTVSDKTQNIWKFPGHSELYYPSILGRRGAWNHQSRKAVSGPRSEPFQEACNHTFSTKIKRSFKREKICLVRPYLGHLLDGRSCCRNWGCCCYFNWLLSNRSNVTSCYCYCYCRLRNTPKSTTLAQTCSLVSVTFTPAHIHYTINNCTNVHSIKHCKIYHMLMVLVTDLQ
jgi:hypothetical protein